MTATARFRRVALPGDDGAIYVLESTDDGDGTAITLGLFGSLGLADSDDIVRSIFWAAGLLSDSDADLDTDPPA